MNSIFIIPEKYSSEWLQKIDNYYKYKYLIINNYSTLSNYLIKDKLKMEKLYQYSLFIIIIKDNKNMNLNNNVKHFLNLLESRPAIKFHRIFYYYCDINGFCNNKCIDKFNLNSNFKYHRVFNFELHKSNIIDFYLKYGNQLSPVDITVQEEFANSIEMMQMNNNLKFIQKSKDLKHSKIEFKKINRGIELNYIDYYIFKELEEVIRFGPTILKETYFYKLYITETDYEFNMTNTLFYKIISKAPKYLSLLTDIFAPEVFNLLMNGHLEEFINETDIKYDTTKNIINNIMVNMYDKQLQEEEVNQKIKCIQERLENANECVICLDTIENPTILNCCQNKCCLECILYSYKSKSNCPFCRDKTHYLDNLTILNNDGNILTNNLNNVEEENVEPTTINVPKIMTKCKTLEKFEAIKHIVQEIHKYTLNSKIVILSDRNYKIYDKDLRNNHIHDWDEIASGLSKINIRPNVHKDDDFHNDNHRTYLIYKIEKSNIYHTNIRSKEEKKTYFYKKVYYNKCNHFSYAFKNFDLQNCTDIIIPQYESPQAISNIKLFSETLNSESPIRIWQVTCRLENE